MKKTHHLLYSILAGSVILAAAYSCSKSDGDSYAGGNGEGKGGSMARFAIEGDHLYCVDHETLKTVRLTDPQKPQYLDLRDKQLGFDIETIFPSGDKLFIGSQSGMHIYDIQKPEFPEMLSQTAHFRSCDPVVAAGDYAYVTLNSDGVNCGRSENEIQVYDISDLKNPRRVYTNTSDVASPKGLSVDEAAARLFVCDGRKGILGFNLSNPERPELDWDLTDFPELKGADAYDCITMDGLLMVIGNDGLFQFDYTGENIVFKSKIDLRK